MSGAFEPLVIRRRGNDELLAMARDGQITGDELAKLWDYSRGNWSRLGNHSRDFSGPDEEPAEFFARVGAVV